MATSKPKLDYIEEGLRSLAVPLEDLNLDPSNARMHDDRNLEIIRGSLERFGQYMPIIVQDQGRIVRIGNGRVMAARKLGWTHIAALVVDESNVEAVQRALVDNRSSELATWEDSMLGHILNSLQDDGIDLIPLGWNDDELPLVIDPSELPEDEMEPPEEFPEVDADIQTEHECPKCGYKWSGTSG